MTIAVDLGRKATKQTNKQHHSVYYSILEEMPSTIFLSESMLYNKGMVILMVNRLKQSIYHTKSILHHVSLIIIMAVIFL